MLATWLARTRAHSEAMIISQIIFLQYEANCEYSENFQKFPVHIFEH